MKEKKEKYVDDGHTIYNMDVEGFPWHEKNKRQYASNDEKKSLVKAAYKAYLPILLLVIVSFTLAFILLYFWLK